MNALLTEICNTQKFTNKAGKIINIDSHTSYDQCLFLQDLIAKNNFTKSIEIGFAYGTSTVAIAEAIAKNNGKHVVIDKFQIDQWGSYGLEIVDLAGYSDYIEFYEKFCYETLPILLLEGRTFNFAYIDSTNNSIGF